MRRLPVSSAFLMALVTTLLYPLPPASAQRFVSNLPAKWSADLYRENPDFVQVIIDMRSVNSETTVIEVQGSVTLYATGNRYLRTIKFTTPSGALTNEKLNVMYFRCAATAPVAKAYAISAAAKIAVPPPGKVREQGTALPADLKIFPGVAVEYDKKVRLTGVRARDITFLSPRPQRKAIRRGRRRR